MQENTQKSSFDRTTCKDVNSSQIGNTITLSGWVADIRNLGSIFFLTLRDRYGLVQFVLEPDANGNLEPNLENIFKGLSYEYCVSLTGVVRKRPDNMINKDMPSGEVEVKVSGAKVLSKCAELPFMILDETQATETLRLKYRYLDLRSKRMQYNIALRHKVSFAVRKYLVSRDFFEIETPTLIRSTPEGSRDFVVPSRIHQGKFWALPQSPQLFKQILMVSGFDRYFQIAHCFRDEDARGDRQPEHTQIDIEMSFPTQDMIFEMVEGLHKTVYKEALDYDLKTPFPRFTYHDAVNTYGSDKPDIRINLKLQDLTDYFKENANKDNLSFDAFKTALANNGVVKALVVPNKEAEFSRKKTDELNEAAKQLGVSALYFAKYKDGEFSGGISKYLDKSLVSKLDLKSGDIVFFTADKWKKACFSLGAIRKQIGNELATKDPSMKSSEKFAYCWIVSFPLFAYNEEEKCWEAEHHIFSMPEEKYIDTLESNPAEVRGQLYDLVCNGYEMASGSIRVHDIDLQKRLFKIIGITDEEAEKRFGFLLEAFKYGPPPHGGIAPGLDRLLMIMTGGDTIKDVIAFPKNNTGFNPLDSSPAEIFDVQFKELGINITKKD